MTLSDRNAPQFELVEEPTPAVDEATPEEDAPEDETEDDGQED